MQYGMMGFMGGWGGMAFGGLMMIFWLVLLVGLVVLVVKWLGGAAKSNASQDAGDTLKQRFARGEIDAKEFEDRTRLLKGAE